MTPKEKAEELINKFQSVSVKLDDWGLSGMDIHSAKRCSLVAVCEIICANPHSNPFNTEVYSTIDYWQEVKQEIYKL
jgi:hypothetical protein